MCVIFIVYRSNAQVFADFNVYNFFCLASAHNLVNVEVAFFNNVSVVDFGKVPRCKNSYPFCKDGKNENGCCFCKNKANNCENSKNSYVEEREKETFCFYFLVGCACDRKFCIVCARCFFVKRNTGISVNFYFFCHDVNSP